jgi:hypothetical protein
MWKLCRSCGDLPAVVEGRLRACATPASLRDVTPDGPDLAPVLQVSRLAIGSHLKAKQAPASSGWWAWHSGCQRAPAIRRPEVETFRSARRTGAICGSPPNRPGGSGVRGRQAATAPSRLAAPRGAA